MYSSGFAVIMLQHKQPPSCSGFYDNEHSFLTLRSTGQFGFRYTWLSYQAEGWDQACLPYLLILELRLNDR